MTVKAVRFLLSVSSSLLLGGYLLTHIPSLVHPAVGNDYPTVVPVWSFVNSPNLELLPLVERRPTGRMATKYVKEEADYVYNEWKWWIGSVILLGGFFVVVHRGFMYRLWKATKANAGPGEAF